MKDQILREKEYFKQELSTAIREEIGKLKRAGLSNKEIAYILDIEDGAVRVDVSHNKNVSYNTEYKEDNAHDCRL